MINLMQSISRARNSISFYRLLAATLLFCLALVSIGSGQVPIPTNRSDNQRSGSNVNETILTLSNVNKNQFGALFNYPIDYLALAQPLYVPNVSIPGQGTHNVVYVATMADSVYAFDADSNTGANATPLWWVNFTNPAIYGPGITTAGLSTNTLPCAGGKTTGFTQEGIAGTPTINLATGTMYVVAKTLENGTVRHRLHALDITTGAEKFGGPTLIGATATSNKGHVWTFNSLHQLNRPALLLSGGTIYMGFGSNSCNDVSAGWVLAYNESTLQQIGSFNSSPDIGLTSIWQTGNGLAADGNGHIYAVTAESTNYDVPNGGQSFSHSVLEFTPNPALQNSLVMTDYFTPDEVVYMNSHDLDLSSGGPVILPDQDGDNGSPQHLVVTAGKTGRIYVLNRDELGMFSGTANNDDQLSPLPGGTGGQEIDGDFGKLGGVLGPMFSSPAYWNGMLYYAGDGDELKAFAVTGTYPPVTTTPVMMTVQKYPGSHSPSISANGTSDGILWVMSGTIFYAFNAANLQQQLYNSSLVKARDALPPIAHFVTQTIADGKVFIAGQTTLQVYGLLPMVTLVSGANQSSPILTTLPAPIQLQVIDAYSGAGVAGVTVNFSDGGKKGTFNPASPVSDSNGNVSTSYTFSKTAGLYTITASSARSTTLSFTETALTGGPTKVITYSGNKQTGQAGSILPTPLRVQVQDASGNGVAGVTVTFVDQSGLGTLNPTSGESNSSGFVQVSYQLPNTAGTYKIVATGQGLTKTAQFSETATGNGPENVSVGSGSNQSAPVSTTLSQPLVVQVSDQAGNPIPGVSVVFSASSGTFTGSPATTGSNGSATASYTTGPSPGPATITAAVNRLSTQFAVNVIGNAATVTPSGGNNQAGTAGTALPQALTVVVADQYGNPVPGVLVNYSDGGAGGTFSNSNPVTTDNTGTASQFYTLPLAAGTITITAAATGVTNPAVFTENSVAGPPANAVPASGSNQSGAAGTQLPQALTVLVTDRFGNPVAGVNVGFSDGGTGGTFSNSNPIATNPAGAASQFYTLPPSLGTVTITATAAGVTNPAVFTENSVSGPAANISITGGNNQLAPAGTQLPQGLAVVVTDQYGNPVAGVNVGFDDGGAGGSFSNPNPVATDNTGTATQIYTLSPNPGTVYINASATGVANPAVFTETGQ